MTRTKEQAKEEIGRLINKLEEVVREGKESDYSEADVGSKFILPLIEKLGWDIKNIDEVKEQKRTLFGPVDYSLNIDKKPKILLEIKKFESLDGSRIKRGKKQTYPEQAIDYAWSVKTDWAVLTNFKETRLYYSHVKKPEEGIIFKLNFSEYLEQFDNLWLLSKESAVSGVLDTYEKKRTRETIDVAILKDLHESRILLTNNIHLKNPELDKNLLRECVQKILDRLIVMRVAEDRNIISSDSIFKQLETWKETVLNKEVRTFMMDLKNTFRDFDFSYNTKLFEEHPCDDLKIDNDIIEEVINRLYNYNFEMISSDVLGAVYENYIGHILKEFEEGVEIAEDKKVRKIFGIYYTPTYVVDYIVKNTLGEVLKDKTPKEVSKIRVLDPACGSGSFLIKAFDYLKEYYDKYNKKARENARKNKSIREWNSIPKVERKILTENLFGVDLDEQAAEIASVNLMLKGLKKGEKLPLILGENIKVGNSLISGSEDELKDYFGNSWKDKKPFNWDEEFKEVFEQGGFDIVIGNPPWIESKKMGLQDKSYYKSNFSTMKKQYDIFNGFVERGLKVLKDGGYLSFILPNRFLMNPDYEKFRKFLLRNAEIVEILDIGENVFASVEMPALIVTLRKQSEEVKRNNNIIRIRTGLKKPESIQNSDWIEYYIPQQRFWEENKCLFSVYQQPKLDSIIKKIEVKSQNLKELVYNARGVEIGKRSPLISVERKGANYVPFLVGEDIDRYLIRNSRYLKLGDPSVDYKSSSLYEGEKILIRKTGTGIKATYDNSGYYVIQVIYILKAKVGINLKFLLALLNSKLMSFYYFSKFGEKSKRVFPHLRQETLLQLPIRTINFANPSEKAIYDRLIALVDVMLSTNQKLNSIHINFYEMARITSETGKLNHRHCLALSKTKRKSSGLTVDYYEDKYLIVKDDGDNILRIAFDNNITKRYVKLYLESIPANEINKETGRLSTRLQHLNIHGLNNVEYQKEILKEYDAKIKKRRDLIKLRDETDKAIDQKVYELYALSEEEIEKVEKSL
ncbi:hypothetical protein CW713_08665 [Methanophagales archaeon]|nr:MAG: hypothetical protein CW713_08665 [Methanophagales archaeon]